MSKPKIRINFQPPKDAIEAALQILYQLLATSQAKSISTYLGFLRQHLPVKEVNKTQAYLYGCFENLVRIDYELKQILNRPLEEVEPIIQTSLRLGAFLLSNSQKQDYAIINELCNLLKKQTNAHSGLVAFLNAGLRKYQEVRPFVYPANKPYLKYSLKPELFGHLKKSMPKEKLNSVLASMNKQLPLYCFYRPSAAAQQDLKIFKEEFSSFLTDLSKEGVQVKTLSEYFSEEQRELGVFSRLQGVFVLYLQEKILNQLAAFTEGKFFVQGLAAMLVSSFLEPQAGELIWDICAAPGGKTFYSYFYHELIWQSESESASTNKKVSETANLPKLWYMSDISEKRIEKIKENQARLRLKTDFSSLYTIDASQELPEELSEKLDWVICDVPCSGLGLLAQKPDIKWKMSHETINNLLPLQQKILCQSAKMVKRNGTLIYSTCTLNQAENEEQIATFLKSKAGENFSVKKTNQATLAQLKGQLDHYGYTIYPDEYPTEGFYFCLLKKEN